MTLLALGLVLASAVAHATWNLLAKRAGGGAVFVWLFGSLASALYLPLAAGALVVDWAQYFGCAAVLTPVALGRLDEAKELRGEHRREILGTAVLSPVAYIPVLSAVAFTPVSYVAPAREVSILIGAVMGRALLTEGEPPRRLASAGGIVVGVVLIAGG